MKKVYMFALSALVSLSLGSCTEGGGGSETGDEVAVTGIEINSDDANYIPDTNTLTIAINATATLVAKITPTDATDKGVNWSSTDSAVASVADGVVTGLTLGTATIIATSAEGGKTAMCNVTVVESTDKVTGVELPDTISIIAGENDTLTADVLPATAANKNVSWRSDNEEVATVADGLVTALAVGEAVITVTTEDGGYEATCTVTVEPYDHPVLGIITFRTDRTWSVGDGRQIWSDVVMATRCKKSDYDGGSTNAGLFKVDCCENEGYGDMFSWEAVNQNQQYLCPIGWRVPTKDDFCLLDKLVNNRADCASPRVDHAAIDRYVNDWNFEWCGWIESSGVINWPGEQGQGSYWTVSTSEYNELYAYNMGLVQNDYNAGHVAVQSTSMKEIGIPVRCIKDTPESTSCPTCRNI